MSLDGKVNGNRQVVGSVTIDANLKDGQTVPIDFPERVVRPGFDIILRRDGDSLVIEYIKRDKRLQGVSSAISLNTDYALPEHVVAMVSEAMHRVNGQY